MADDTTIGTYFSVKEQREILEPFDDALDIANIDSRSAGMKRAMKFYMTFIELCDELGYDFTAEQAERAWMRQAIINLAAREHRDS